jgi:hypothetical protein
MKGGDGWVMEEERRDVDWSDFTLIINLKDVNTIFLYYTIIYRGVSEGRGEKTTGSS